MKSHTRNAAFNIAGEAVWGFQWDGAALATVLPVLMKAYGAGPIEIGAITAIECAVMAPQVLGVFLFHSRRRRQRQLILWYVLLALPILALLALVAHSRVALPPTHRRAAILVAFGAYATATGIGAGAWNDWLAHLFPRAIRGRVLGLGAAMMALAGIAGAFIVGRIVSRYVDGSTAADRYDTYAYVYFAAAGVAMLAMGLYAMIKDPSVVEAVATPPPAVGELLRRFADSLADRNFRAFLIGRVLATVGFSIAALATLYYRSDSGGALAAGQVISLGAAIPLGKAAGNFLLGRLGDRRGHRLGVVIGATVQVAAVTLLLISRGPVSCALVYAGVGFALGGTWICHFNMVVESCPHDHRLAHITLSSMVLALPLSVAPILSGLVVQVWGFRTLFAICLGINIAALAWFLMQVKEPRTLPVYQSDE